ncbi:hypothetical protein CUAC110507_00450 [Cutibacterium acnes subsp. defendens]|nr:hypothetical protein HMPREF1277_00092 [Propionibacterium sp. KPL1847]ERS67589.1 hypothetical protein HMPREF1278_01156 [Propionibacterium sp. KPL1849]
MVARPPRRTGHHAVPLISTLAVDTPAPSLTGTMCPPSAKDIQGGHPCRRNTQRLEGDLDATVIRNLEYFLPSVLHDGVDGMGDARPLASVFDVDGNDGV